ncbi:Nucleotide-binding universal stress protein, UspA family [Halorubrum aquaticum]|uniref:Nucleotide-binding universal stress protein, UspA family n=1 Tax=Halorubrum aquaticum TaxID=387340 RepID=A0A1I2Z607_9EURY|nr:universal stress protein [Halorubrum aquaticum]SFH33292.1 Nucleotide-binding universal stress protein, UspA family [Halorubrum aquaticum]
MYDDVLLPFDGSDGAADVLEHAADIARFADATVHVLFVADTARDSVTVIEGETVDALERRGERVVSEATEELAAAGVDHDAEVRQGNPAPTIVDHAEREGHDLIVMPTRGRRGLSRRLLGSVSEKVVRNASVPVLTARTRPDERLAFPYEGIVVPTDGSVGADAGVDHGLALAAALDATVHALAVVDDAFDPLEGLLGTDADEDEATAAANAALDDVVAAAEEYGVDRVERHVERGDPVEAIRDRVSADGADAVVMGATGEHGDDRVLLGSVAERTVRTAPVPVLTVRE